MPIPNAAGASPPEPSDAALMSQTRAGDEAAFGRLVERYMDRVVGYLSRLTGNRAKAEDLAQETFLQLYRRRDRYAENGTLRAYLYRIATNLLLSEQRRAARRSLLHRLFLSKERAPEPSPAATPQSDLLASEAQRQVSAALGHVPTTWRAPLLLYAVEGMSYAEIAAALGWREGTVKSRVSRGRAFLRKRLAPYFDSLGGKQ